MLECAKLTYEKQSYEMEYIKIEDSAQRSFWTEEKPYNYFL